jgi:hypothetical protein
LRPAEHGYPRARSGIHHRLARWPGRRFAPVTVAVAVGVAVAVADFHSRIGDADADGNGNGNE